MNTKEILELENRYIAPYSMPYPIVIARGQGVWLWDTDGRKYLDCVCSFGAVSQGHCHPRLLKALHTQAEKLTLVTRNTFHSETLGPLMEKLCHLTHLDQGIAMNSGVEAVETAIKAVRRWGYRVKKIPHNQAEIIVATNNFHGRTVSTISCSSEPSYQKDFGPFTPGFVSIPFGDSEALEKAITPRTAAFFIEPIQGESGIWIPPQGWLKEVAAICKKHHVLLILDEIQTGFGRTGKMFGYEHDGIQPDGVILGKSLGGGIIPISAFVAKKEIMGLFEPGSHGSTYGGNPLAAAVAMEAIKVIEEEHLVEKSAELGAYMLKEMKKWLPHPYIVDIRGRGLFIALQIDPDKIDSRFLSDQFMVNGILSRDTRKRTLRFAPPLVIKKEEIDWAVAKLHEVIRKNPGK